MKIKNIVTVLLVAVTLASCAPAAKVVPTETAVPTSTFTPAPTATITSTPIPTINVEGQNIPDPRFSNPDFFDVSNANSPIVQFANAFGLKPEDVAAGVHVEIKRPNNGAAPFAVLRTSDGVALLMMNEQKQWIKATPGEYWFAQGKLIGVSLIWDEYRDSRQIIKDYFSKGVMVTITQILPNADPYRPPSDAEPLATDAHANEMSMYYHYVAEPGKFPSGIDKNNVDEWLSERIDGLIQMVLSHKTAGHPAYISFNEAWEGNVWNPEFNPLRERYGEKWVSEYTYSLLSKFIEAGLVPNKDFVVVFNDANLYNRPKKQDLVFNTLSQARQDAFDRLVSDSAMKEKLNQMGINKVEHIQILLGSETHTKLNNSEDSGWFVPAPTDEQVTAMAEKFAPLGGIIMTEVNPFGTLEEKEIFLKEKTALLANLPSLRGILLWNIIKDSDDGRPEYPLSGDRLILFDDQNKPTPLYYELLR
jgi:hypothetical protein